MELAKKQLQKLKELGYKSDYLDKTKFVKEITYNQKYALYFNDFEYSVKYAIETTGFTRISSDFDLRILKNYLKKVQEDYKKIISIND